MKIYPLVMYLLTSDNFWWSIQNIIEKQENRDRVSSILQQLVEGNKFGVYSSLIVGETNLEDDQLEENIRNVIIPTIILAVLFIINEGAYNQLIKHYSIPEEFQNNVLQS